MSSQSGAPPAELTERDLFDIAWERRLRASTLDLLAIFPALRFAVRSRAWPEALNFGFTRWAFPIAVCLLLLGPQARMLS